MIQLSRNYSLPEREDQVIPIKVIAVGSAGSNALDLQQSVKDKMQELSKRFPKGIDYGMHYDTTRFVSAAMHDVVITLAQALVLVVDDAIVVVENVERQLEAGLPPLAATRKAMAEVTGPILATTGC